MSYPLRFTTAIGADGAQVGEFWDFLGRSSDHQDGYDWNKGRTGMVKTVRVWLADDYDGIHGIQFQWQDNSWSTRRGTDSGERRDLVLSPGELISECTLWGNGSGTRAARIRMKTNKGQNLEGGKNRGGDAGYALDVSSGILLGGFGKHGGALDQLGFVFLGPVSSVSVDNMVFDEKQLASPDTMKKASLDKVTYANNDRVASAYNFTNSSSQSQSHTITHAIEVAVGIKVTTKAQIPLIGEGAVEASASFKYTYTNSTTSVDTVTLSWSLSGSLQPSERKECESWCWKGELNEVPFTSRVTMVVDGWNWTFSDIGTFKGVSYSQAYVSVKSLPGA